MIDILLLTFLPSLFSAFALFGTWGIARAYNINPWLAVSLSMVVAPIVVRFIALITG